MKKNYKSIACPECKSSDIDLTVTYENESEEEILYDNQEAATAYTKEKVMKCHCKSCSKDYSVNQGKDNYTLLRQPLPITCSGDVKLLSIYTSEFDRNFRLVQMHQHSQGPIIMALVEDDKYPVILPEEKNIEKDPAKVKSLIFNTWMNRYR